MCNIAAYDRGELAERFSTLLLIQCDRVVDEVPTYRGEGKTFL